MMNLGYGPSIHPIHSIHPPIQLAVYIYVFCLVVSFYYILLCLFLYTLLIHNDVFKPCKFIVFATIIIATLDKYRSLCFIAHY